MTRQFLTKKQEDCIIAEFMQSVSEGNSISDILFRFANNIGQNVDGISDEVKFMLTNAILTYNNIIASPEYLEDFRETFNYVFKKITSSYPNIGFKLERRRKSLVSSVEKLLKLLKQGRSLDMFRDTLGIRLVLMASEEDEEAKQKELYDICNHIIKFLMSQGNILCESENIPNKKPEEYNLGELIVPNQSYISSIYTRCIKDYVAFPKVNGYQSIHMVFRSPKGYFFEVQIRTENMHIRAEYMKANHESYKLSKYSSSQDEQRLIDKISLKDIHMPGFRYLGFKEREFTDYVGFAESIKIYFRNHP